MAAPDKPPFLSRLRHALVGRHEAPAASGRNPGMLGHAPEPGPFDEPPTEPIELDGPLPWELSESETRESETEDQK
ncbi:MAG: hypothetical protein ABWX98_05870 [Lacisediminihabitans sp.]